MHTFYSAPDTWSSNITLADQEAHHAISVLRLSAGGLVRILDGQGHIGIFRIDTIKSRKVLLTMEQTDFAPPPVAMPIIALAFSKAIRRDFFIEKAAELGAHAVWIWQADHSQGKVSSALATSLTRQLIAGIKQSGNPWLPQVKILLGGAQELITISEDIDYRILPWEMQDRNTMLPLDLLGRPGKTLYVIGPEGGFSERELLAFDNNEFTKVSLGSRVLRCETAATLCLGLHWWASHEKNGRNI